MDLLTTTEAPEFQGWFALGQGKGAQTSSADLHAMLNLNPSIINYLLA